MISFTINGATMHNLDERENAFLQESRSGLRIPFLKHRLQCLAVLFGNISL